MTASQTIGLMSTPKAGGTMLLVGLKSHSVGKTTKEKGGLARSVLGYHDITTLHSMRNDRRFRKRSPVKESVSRYPESAAASATVIEVTDCSKPARWGKPSGALATHLWTGIANDDGIDDGALHITPAFAARPAIWGSKQSTARGPKSA